MDFFNIFSLKSIADSSTKDNMGVKTRSYTSKRSTSMGLYIDCADTEFNRTCKEKLQSIGDFRAPWWYSRHLGTIIPFGHDHSLIFEREVLHHTISGGSFAIDWYPHRPEIKSDTDEIKICIFLPCLGGHSDHKFAQNFALSISASNYFTAIVTTRGIGIPLTTKDAWHPAFCDDAYLTLHHVHDLYGSKAKICFSGFSAGSNIVTQTLLKNQQDAIPIHVVGACCVCLVGDYAATRDALETTPMGRIYSYLMAAKHKDILRNNSHAFMNYPVETQKLMACTTLREFDQAACTFLYGFSDEEQLNESFSCRAIAKLTTPYLGIQPRDDPLHMGKVRRNIPLEQLIANDNFIYVEPSAGNHFGFYEGDLWEAFSNKTSYTWPAKCAVTFFEELLKRDKDPVIHHEVDIDIDDI